MATQGAGSGSLVITVVGALVVFVVLGAKYFSAKEAAKKELELAANGELLSDFSEDEEMVSKSHPIKTAKKKARESSKKDADRVVDKVPNPKDKPKSPVAETGGAVDAGVLKMLRKEIGFLEEDKKAIQIKVKKLTREKTRPAKKYYDNDDDEDDENDEILSDAIRILEVDFSGMNKKTRAKTHQLFRRAIEILKNEIESINQQVIILEKKPTIQDEEKKTVALTRSEIEDGWCTVPGRIRISAPESYETKPLPSSTVMSAFAYLNEEANRAAEEEAVKSVFAGEDFPSSSQTVTYGEKIEKKKKKNKKRPQQQVIGLTC